MQGSIRKKGNKYYIRYYENGKQVEKVGGKTKKEAQIKLNEIIYKIEKKEIKICYLLLKFINRLSIFNLKFLL